MPQNAEQAVLVLKSFLAEHESVEMTLSRARSTCKLQANFCATNGVRQLKRAPFF